MAGYGCVIAAALAMTGCYSPAAQDCSYRCTSGACPSGLTCVQGYCRMDPDPGASCEADGGIDGDARMSRYSSVVMANFPVAYWRLGDQTGSSSAKNEINLGENGAVMGSVTFGQPGAIAFDTNTAALFDAVGMDCLSVGDLATFQFTTFEQFTLEVWVKLKGLTSTVPRLAIAKLGPSITSPSGYDLGVDMTGTARFRTCDGTGCQTLQSGTLATGTWIYLAGTYNGPTNKLTKLFVNGTPVSTQMGTTQPPTTTTAPFAIGCRATPSEFFDGFLDEVAVYDRALTDIELMEHYQAALP